MATDVALPTWDLTTLFPSLESDEYTRALANSVSQLSESESLAGSLPEMASVEDVEEWLRSLTDLSGELIRIYEYSSLLTAADSRMEAAQIATSKVQNLYARLVTLNTQITAWLGKQDVEALIAGSAFLGEHALFLRKARVNADKLMDYPREELAAVLTLSGGTAWESLRDDVTSQMEIPFELDGESQMLPLSEIRNLAMHKDRDVRRRAQEAELSAVKLWETPITAALNGVKGEHGELSKRRGWGSTLEHSLFINNMNQSVLDALMGAAKRSFPDFRRYFRAKAKALGVEKLAFYDLFAPVIENERRWEWEEGLQFIYEQFGSFSPRMRGLAERAVEERWIDAGARSGKVGGAFCAGWNSEESRVLANYSFAYEGVSTLAHELGHAYHNLAIAERPWLQRVETPMTLAETASTFCETILRRAAIQQAGPDEALSILEAGLQDAAQTVVDISSRFIFEQAVFAERANRRLSGSEFCELMLDAQKQTYGDGLDEATLHPYMWAVKSHYYSPDFAYYNYPYMFGLLFGTGLYAQYEADPEAFRANYDELLASTGEAPAAELAARFGIDIASEGFWEGSLDVIRAEIDEFERIVDERFS